MIRDSWQGFEFSQLNSLLSWAFWQQDKKIKSLELSKDLWHLNNMKVILALWTMNCVCFSCIDSFHIAHNWTNKFKKNHVLEFSKIMIRPPLIWLINLTLRANFRTTLKSSGFAPLLNWQNKNLYKATIYVSELILTPFDIKYKKMHDAKNLWKCIFRASRRVSFSYFPKALFDNWW